MRNPQGEANDAHSQGQQLFSLYETQNLGAKLIFYERDGYLSCGELWYTKKAQTAF